MFLPFFPNSLNGKHEPVVKFDGAIRHGVVLESHQMQMEYGRETSEYHTFLCFLQAVLSGIILVVSI